VLPPVNTRTAHAANLFPCVITAGRVAEQEMFFAAMVAEVAEMR
jgi:hypothetical protein